MNTTQKEFDWAAVAHFASAATWMFSLDKAMKKGGTAWLPVVVGFAGHFATAAAQKTKNQDATGMGIPASWS